MSATSLRLHALQQLIGKEPGVDALLFVGGVDGRNHAGSRETLNWLLTGLSGRKIYTSRYEQELEEAVLLITADSARLYAPSGLWTKLAPHLARWRRLQVWTPPAELAEDTEAIEEHKIRSFIAMMRGVGSVGVALPAAEAGKGPAAAVEAWPLVQSFALQDFESATGGGFFTQLHVVLGVGEAVRALQLRLDRPGMAWLCDEEAPRLVGCLNECLGTIDSACEAARPLRASEAELFEPALTYATHGKLRAGQTPTDSAVIGGTRVTTGRLARVAALIGSRTSLLLQVSDWVAR